MYLIYYRGAVRTGATGASTPVEIGQRGRRTCPQVPRMSLGAKDCALLASYPILVCAYSAFYDIITELTPLLLFKGGNRYFSHCLAPVLLELQRRPCTMYSSGPSKVGSRSLNFLYVSRPIIAYTYCMGNTVKWVFQFPK